MPHASKSQLRTLLRGRRHSLSAAVQASAERAVSKRVITLPCWTDAQRIALYHGADGEIHTAALASACRSAGKQIFLPVIGADERMLFAQWNEGDLLSENRFGIPQPPAASPVCPVARLDIVFVPVVGWDKKGGRLGMGGGFYDRALAGVSGTILLGLAHEVQEVEEIPRDVWDLSLQSIITERAVYHCAEN